MGWRGLPTLFRIPLVFALILVVGSAPSYGQPSELSLSARAYKAFDEKDYLSAQGYLLSAFKQSKDERIFYALGRTWESMGNLLLSMYAYERFLIKVGQRARPAQVEDARKARQRLVSQLCRLTPRGPSGAWFQVDGGRRHRIGEGALWVWPGNHVVRSARGDIEVTCPKGDRESVPVGALDAEGKPESRSADNLIDDDDEDDDEAAVTKRPKRGHKRGEVDLEVLASTQSIVEEPPPPPLALEQEVLPGGAYLLDAFEAEPPPLETAPVEKIDKSKTAASPSWPLVSLQIAPLLRARRFVIDGDPQIPAQGCYTLDKVLAANEKTNEPRGFVYAPLTSCPNLLSPMGGLALDGVYYPFARRSRFLAGIGLHGALALLPPTQGNGTGVEAELGVRYLLYDLVGRGSHLGFLLDYRAVHAPVFATPRIYPTDLEGRSVDGGLVGADAAGVPSATYHSLALGASLHLPYLRTASATFAFGLSFRYLALLSAGELSSLLREDPPFSGGYGPLTRGQSHGGSLQLTPIYIQTRPDLAFLIRFTYEGYGLRFRVADPVFGGILPPEVRGDVDGARFLASGAREDRFGLEVSLRYDLN